MSNAAENIKTITRQDLVRGVGAGVLATAADRIPVNAAVAIGSENHRFSRHDMLRTTARILTGNAAEANRSLEVANEPTLRMVADSKHFTIGAHTNGSIPASYETKFNHILLDGPLHMNNLSYTPTPGEYDFRKVDDILDTAKEKGVKAQVHHLVWGYNGTDGSRLAPWVQEEIANNGGDPIPVLEQHINAVVDHLQTNHRGVIDELTVVNEPINWNGDYFDVTDAGGYNWGNFWNTASANYYGDARYYIAESFRLADRAVRKGADSSDRPISLLINEWGAEWGGTAKGDAYLNLAHYLAEQGAPVDGIGFQMHLWPGDENHAYYNYNTGENNTLRNEDEIARFAELFRQQANSVPEGMLPYITELSIDSSAIVDLHGRERAKELEGILLYHITKAFVDAGGRSMMIYKPTILASQEEGEPIHQLKQALLEIPGK